MDKEAKNFVNSTCFGETAELDLDERQRRGDRYGRELGVVYCNGVNVNEELMNRHLARILSQYCELSEFSSEAWAKSQCLIAK